MKSAIKIVQSTCSDITICCLGCSAKHNIQPELGDVLKYYAGEKVQNIWPNESPDYREVMIAYRTGLFICPTCNEPNMAEELTDV